MICIYCGKSIDKQTFSSIFLEKDELCYKCRSLLKLDKRKIKIDSLTIETFYDYDGIFRDLLIQYKECFDEALAPVFLYMLKDYLKYKYFGYKIVLMPSSRRKLMDRGFNHLKLIYEPVGLKIIDGLRMKEELVQEGKSLIERQMMKNNYIYEGPRLNKVLLVDDVVTTGSSMIGAYNALKNRCNMVKAVSLASKKKTLSF